VPARWRHDHPVEGVAANLSNGWPSLNRKGNQTGRIVAAW
jgi:hypothetical protein